MARSRIIDEQSHPSRDRSSSYWGGMPAETEEEYVKRVEAEEQAIADHQRQQAINWEKVGIPNMYQTQPDQTDQVMNNAMNKAASQAQNLPQAPMQEVKMNTQELDDLRSMLKEYEKKGNKMDWSPLLALTDAWTGSNLAQSYDRPMTKTERDKLVMGLKSRIYDAQAQMKRGQDDLAFKLKKWSEERQDKLRGQNIELEKARLYSGANQGRNQGQEDRNQRQANDSLFRRYKDTYTNSLAQQLGLDADDPTVKARAPLAHNKAMTTARQLMAKNPGLDLETAYGAVVERMVVGQ